MRICWVLRYCPAMAEPVAIRAPDHLGDATMAIPAMRAVAGLGPVEVHGPRFLPDLFDAVGFPNVTVRSSTEIPERGVGLLFKPSFRSAWLWRHLDRRIGLAENGRGLLLTDPLPPMTGEHRRQGYSRIAAALGATVLPVARRPSIPGFIGLNPWSPTATVRWPWFRELADLLAPIAPIVFFAGPGEEAAVRAIAGPYLVRAGLALPELAASLRDCGVFVSNDSGAAHFADAVGVPVLTIHGSTDPSLTGVGAAISGGPIWCGPCYRKTCVLGLQCLTRIGPAAVSDAVRKHLDALANTR